MYIRGGKTLELVQAVPKAFYKTPLELYIKLCHNST